MGNFIAIVWNGLYTHFLIPVLNLEMFEYFLFSVYRHSSLKPGPHLLPSGITAVCALGSDLCGAWGKHVSGGKPSSN